MPPRWQGTPPSNLSRSGRGAARSSPFLVAENSIAVVFELVDPILADGDGVHERRELRFDRARHVGALHAMRPRASSSSSSVTCFSTSPTVRPADDALGPPIDDVWPLRLCRTCSSTRLNNSQFSRFSAVRMRTSENFPCSFSPCTTKSSRPFFSPARGSPIGSHRAAIPHDHGAAPPYSPCGMLPSKSR